MKTTPYIIIIALLLIIFFQRECHRCPECNEQVRVDTVYRYDSIPYTPPAMTPKPGTVVEQPIPAGIDSLAVARAYFSRRMGIDTLVNDSLYMLSLRWEITENTPVFYQPTIIDRKPTTIISHTITEKPRAKLFAGFDIGYTVPNQHISSFASIGLLTKRDNYYQVMFDPIDKTVLIGMKWKIVVNRKK